MSQASPAKSARVAQSPGDAPAHGAMVAPTRVLHVLYVHPFAVYGGATKSLGEMFAALPAGSVRGTVLTPPGIAGESFRKAGLRVIPVWGISQWDDTRIGHYRGARWLLLLREIAYLPATLLALGKARKLGPYDIIHCNDINVLLVGVLAKWLLRAPLVVHVRSLQRGKQGGRMTSRYQRVLEHRTDAVIAIDKAVHRTLPQHLPVHIIYNGMRLPPNLPPRKQEVAFRVGYVGVLHRIKGVYEFVEAARLLRDRGLDVRFVVAGDDLHRLSGLRKWLLRKLDLARDVRGDLERYVKANGLQEVVEFTGFVADIHTVYSRLDVLCFPSHLDAPGRPVLEAALLGLPSIVAMTDPTDDVIISGRTGLCLAAPTPAAIADAVEALARDRARTLQMGEEARRIAASRFESSVSASRVLELYRSILTCLGTSDRGTQ